MRELFMSRKPLNEIGGIDIRDFALICTGGKVTAVEYLVDGRIVVESTNVNLEARFDDTDIQYRIKGVLVPFGTREIRKGGFFG